MRWNTGHARLWRLELVRRAWSREHTLVLGNAALVLCVVWLAWPTSEPAGRTPSTSGSSAPETRGASEVSQLRAALERESQTLQRLERDVSLLRARLALLEPEAPGVERAEASPREPVQPRVTAARSRRSGGVFDRGALVAAGVDAQDADWLRETWEDVEMEKIYLSNQAAREGWAGTARHRQELHALDTGLREELSPEDYDRYLYGMGKSNRARVTDVIDRSPGAAAGFAVGDVILSYDGQPVFDVGTLGRLASSGRLGDTVRVEVARGGSTAFLSVPRGPIGLMLVPYQQPPP